MNKLLGLCGIIDFVNEKVGKAVNWLVLFAVLISSGNAMIRYTFNNSSNAWLEVQWYAFAAIFLLCSPYTLLRNEHIRIDVFSGKLSKRAQTWIDILGAIFFLLPMTITIMWLSFPMVLDSFYRMEQSSDAGGLIRWPVKVLIPIGFFLLSAQGISELLKRVAFLAGAGPDPSERYHAHGSTANEELIEKELASVIGTEQKP